jgi:hypothetical protein
LKQAFQERECEFTDGAGHFEKREDDRTLLESVGEREILAVG